MGANARGPWFFDAHGAKPNNNEPVATGEGAQRVVNELGAVVGQLDLISRRTSNSSNPVSVAGTLLKRILQGICLDSGRFPSMQRNGSLRNQDDAGIHSTPHVGP